MPFRATRAALLQAALAPFLLLLASCSLFDSGTPWRDDRYALIWIDEPRDVSLDYDLGHGGWSVLVDARVFAVGSDGRYVVAKQHPHGNRSVTNYFIVDKQADPERDRARAVVGPLTAQEFEVRQHALQLPAFTKVLASLE